MLQTEAHRCLQSHCRASRSSAARWVDIKEMTVSPAALLNTLFPRISVLLVQENKVSQRFTESTMVKGLKV